MDILIVDSDANPRLKYIDTETTGVAFQRLVKYADEIVELIASEPEKLAQTRHSMLALQYEAIALCAYGLGASLSDVKRAFRHAVRAAVEVFRLRGTESPFPAYSLLYDRNYAPSDPESIAEFTTLSNPQEKDYSSTHSRRGYQMVCEALITGDIVLAEEIALLIWDPPDAAYIGPGSFCTPNDQHVAYALRELFRGDMVSMNSELAKVKRGNDDQSIAHQAKMLWALGSGDRKVFSDALHAQLNSHSKQAQRKENRLNPLFFICIPGLGMASLALSRELCGMDYLPQGSPFLPLSLLQA
jgi:hypothetical protein